jgi:hypothetical protein
MNYIAKVLQVGTAIIHKAINFGNAGMPVLYYFYFYTKKKQYGKYKSIHKSQ